MDWNVFSVAKATLKMRAQGESWGKQNLGFYVVHK